ncbi:MAG TPA: phosphotyrosine protein phosphatase [Micromonosporaceae bacterium]|jgi:protein-tyrosine phosphatase
MSPLVVLHVCMGNICRSPMSERLLLDLVRERAGASAADLLVSESTGTGGWHVGQAMNPPAARELQRRGVADSGFRARRLAGDHLDRADLVLTATSEQLDFALSLRPDVADRAFVLGEFGRLAESIDPAGLPPVELTVDGVYERGVALVTAVDKARDGAAPLISDDLDDPYGRNDAYYQRTADQIVRSLRPLVERLV